MNNVRQVENISISPPGSPGAQPDGARPAGRVGPEWTVGDYLGAIGVRLNVRRMRYIVTPGLYAFGSPGPDSPVLVSANYKLSFDQLRRALTGLNAWILALDTDGVNVWRAAGKGTFGTDELVRKIRDWRLHDLVTHRRLILPQLGAPGVADHEIKKQTCFAVVYGPVYAADIAAFLQAGFKATPEMRRVRFRWRERLTVAPLELVIGFRRMLLAGLVLAALTGVRREVRLALPAQIAVGAMGLLAWTGAGLLPAW